MSADVLRRAAALIRERAEAAPPSPWELEHTFSGAHVQGVWSGVDPDEGESVAMCESPTAEHIASWHPAVALAVADWLDEAARWHEHHETWGGIPFGTPDEALAVARAYLGESA